MFVSIYESDSSDSTPASLALLAYLLTSLSIPHSIPSSSPSPSPSPSPSAHPTPRIEHLTAVRNAALSPLFSLPPPPFHRLLFLNDVLFCAEDALHLLSLAHHTRADLACGLDFDDPQRTHTPRFYDTWVMRGRRGGRVGKDWPYFAENEGGREVREGRVVDAFCCWNGMAVLDARLVWEFDLHFRAHDKGVDGEEGEGMGGRRGRGCV